METQAMHRAIFLDKFRLEQLLESTLKNNKENCQLALKAMKVCRRSADPILTIQLHKK
jgi:hypothetical protein